MLTLGNVLSMSAPLRLATVATIAGLLFTSPSLSQTYTTCSPLQGSCPPDTALGKSVNIAFSSGASDQFTAQGVPTYDSNGVSLTVAKSGDAPTLVSKWYIMFGTYSITMKAAPGTGIVSSAVLQSDDLDEIDWEWLGAQDGQVQSNYFGKGQTTTYDRAAVHAVTDTQGDFHTYTVQWTESQIVWSIDGTTVRVLNADQANGQYPQTPMQLKIGAWSGGDPSNAPGTIQWAGGSTDYSAGPFSMVVKAVSVTDYSTGTQYSYGDTSGSWESIHAAGGSVNGNSGGSATMGTAPAITSTSSGNGAWDGTHRSDFASATYTTLIGLPSGWTVSGSGKAIPPSAATTTSQSALPSSSPAPSAAPLCSVSGYSVVTSYDQRGFLTTATVPAGISTGWDDRGFATTIYPANCQASQPPMAAGAILRVSTLEQKVVTATPAETLHSVTADATGFIATDTSEPSTSGGSKVVARWIAGSCTAFVALALAGLLA